MNGSENDCIYLPERGHECSRCPQVKGGIKKASKDLKPAYYPGPGKEGWEEPKTQAKMLRDDLSFLAQGNTCQQEDCLTYAHPSPGLVRSLSCFGMTVESSPRDLPGGGQPHDPIPSSLFL